MISPSRLLEQRGDISIRVGLDVLEDCDNGCPHLVELWVRIDRLAVGQGLNDLGIWGEVLLAQPLSPTLTWVDQAGFEQETVPCWDRWSSSIWAATVCSSAFCELSVQFQAYDLEVVVPSSKVGSLRIPKSLP